MSLKYPWKIFVEGYYQHHDNPSIHLSEVHHLAKKNKTNKKQGLKRAFTEKKSHLLNATRIVVVFMGWKMDCTAFKGSTFKRAVCCFITSLTVTPRNSMWFIFTCITSTGSCYKLSRTNHVIGTKLIGTTKVQGVLPLSLIT